MRDLANHRLTIGLGLMLGLLAWPVPARAGKLSWLDEVVQQVVREAEAGSKTAARGARTPSARAAERLFVREADEGLEALAKRSDDLARLGRKLEEPSEALLEARFGRLLRPEPEVSRTFRSLAPAEKLAYLGKREAHLQYPHYQQQGWPIGSGIVESGNKVVMQERMKRAGMHWAPAHVNPMLALRNAVCNDRGPDTNPQSVVQ